MDRVTKKNVEEYSNVDAEFDTTIQHFFPKKPMKSLNIVFSEEMTPELKEAIKNAKEVGEPVQYSFSVATKAASKEAIHKAQNR